MAKVKFVFEDKTIENIEVDNVPLGTSILDITHDNDIHLNHNCGAVCACSTCHVKVLKGMEFIKEISDTEEDFIDRAIDPTLDSRLACQSIILDEHAVLEVEIPDQSDIIGHEH